MSLVDYSLPPMLQCSCSLRQEPASLCSSFDAWPRMHTSRTRKQMI